MTSAHKEGGTRDPSQLARQYRALSPSRLENRAVVLIDDVVTSGAKLCAAARHLADRGVLVEEPAFVVARTVHEKGVAARTLTQSYAPWPREREPEDEPAF